MILIIFICLPHTNTICSEDAYPLIINGFSESVKGESIIIEDTSSNELIVYNLSYNFAKGYEKISVTKSSNPGSTNGYVLNDSKVLAYAKHKTQLLILGQENDTYFMAIINESGELKFKTHVLSSKLPINFDECSIISLVEPDEFLMKIDGKIYNVVVADTGLNLNFLNNSDGNLLRLENSTGFSKSEYITYEEQGPNLIMNFFDVNSLLLNQLNITNLGFNRFINTPALLIHLTSNDKTFNQTMVQFIDKNKGSVKSGFWIDSEIDNIHISVQSGKFDFFYIETGSEGYNLCKAEIIPDNPKLFPVKSHLSGSMTNPILLKKIDELIFCIFSNSMLCFDSNLNILASKFFPIEKQIEKLSDLLKYGNQYFLYSKSNLVSFNVVENEYWFLKKIYYDINAYLLPIILTIILIILIQLYRHQKRLVNELLALPNIGLLFVVDTNGRLININNSGREFLGMSANIPIGNFFRFYAKNNSAVPFADLIDRTLQNKDGINQKISIIIENNESEWFCKSIPLRNMTGMFRGVVLSAVDITEQLERKRLSNWAQLAHDMQTNLSTIKLNAEHLDIELSENNFSRQKRIIYQVNLLMQRVRDIVTVGRNENLILETHNVFDICHEVREEFDELMFPNIEFIIDVKPQLIACDKPKLIRALRNAAENGIKAMKGNPGTITFKAVHDKKFVSISVEDSGQGMDDDTKQKMLIPYFTTASKSGGSGIGTMIMQHVAELHGGYLTVESEKDKGTQVIFHIPNTLLNRRV